MDPVASPAEPTQASTAADVAPAAARRAKYHSNGWTVLAALLAMAPLGASAYIHPYLFTSEIFHGARTALNDSRGFIRLARVRESTIFATGVDILATPKGAWPVGRNRDAVVIETTIKSGGALPVETTWEDRMLEHFRENKDNDPSLVELRDRFLREAGGPCHRKSADLSSGGAAPDETALTRSAFRLLAALDPCEATTFGEIRGTILPRDLLYSLRTGTNAAALDTGRARLVPALKSVKLALNSKKTLRIQGGYKNLPCIDPSSGNCDGTPYDLDGFMFEIIQKATSRVECESGNAAFAGRVNLGNWPDAMKEILSQPAGSAPLNSTFHLLRTTHLARREDVLHAGIDTKKAPAPRGKAYRQALASIPSIGDLLAKRLQESLSGQLWWHCLWLTSLASDLVAERPDMATALFAPITKLANSATDPVVKAQAVVALARGEKPPLAKALAKGLAPTGAPLVHRRLAVAAYYLDKRFGGTTLDRFKTSESRLFKFLRKARST
jgi:hypothetical protein